MKVIVTVEIPDYEKKYNTVSSKRKKKEVIEKDVHTPEDAYSDTTPIEQFEPDLTKPIKVTVTDDKGNRHVVDGQQMTPIETDDLMEELTDEEQQREELKK